MFLELLGHVLAPASQSHSNFDFNYGHSPLLAVGPNRELAGLSANLLALRQFPHRMPAVVGRPAAGHPDGRVPGPEAAGHRGLQSHFTCFIKSEMPSQVFVLNCQHIVEVSAPSIFLPTFLPSSILLPFSFSFTHGWPCPMTLRSGSARTAITPSSLILFWIEIFPGRVGPGNTWPALPDYRTPGSHFVFLLCSLNKNLSFYSK